MPDRTLEFFVPGIPVAQGDLKPHRWWRKGEREIRLTRWTQYIRTGGSDEMVPEPGGEWVHYAEIEAEVQRILDAQQVRMVHAHARKLMAWRGAVAAAARKVWTGPPTDKAVSLSCTFYFPRPKSAEKRLYPTKRSVPDGDKLRRAIGDALTGVLYVDDSQIVNGSDFRRYDNEGRPGVSITVKQVEP